MLWLRQRRREGAPIIDYFDELEEGCPDWIGDIWQLPDENAWMSYRPRAEGKTSRQG
jgi:hypothetical protein